MRIAAMTALAAAVLAAPSLVYPAAQEAGGNDRVKKLEERVAALEKRQAQLEQRVARGGGADPAKEQAAQQVLQTIQQNMKDLKFQEAKAKLNELNTQYAGTNAQRSAARLNQELVVIGKAAPASYKIAKWFQGEGEFDMANGKPTLLVFWEQWCPHCRREIPKVGDIYTRYKPKGLQVVGLTRVTRSSTDEGVAQFCKEQNVLYPMAKETGEIASHFNVSGIPAAAAVKDGKVIWRGHPASITDAMIESWIGG